MHLQKSARMFLQIAGASADEIEKELTRLPGVKHVSKDDAQLDDSLGFVIEVEEENNIRRTLHPMIVNKGWDLVEMRNLHMSLEDVFIKLITKETAQ